MRSTHSVLVLLAVALSQGCTTGFYLQGGRIWNQGIPAQAEAAYTAPICAADAAPDQPIAFNANYYLVQTRHGPGLVEIDQNGKAALITNHWNDAVNDYYFAYVRTAHGYLFTLPMDRSQPGTRAVYLRNSNWTSAHDGIATKPVGTPTVHCALTPMAAPSGGLGGGTVPPGAVPPPPEAAPPAAVPEAAPPAPPSRAVPPAPPTRATPGCTQDYHCKGIRVCVKGECQEP